ncbi:MAG: hypothetical protein ABIP69_02575, partial [Ferruginibacter sp.]
EEYLKIVARDKEIKLTPLGALPRKVLVEIYDKGILSEELIDSGISKVTSEHDCVSIRSARITVGLAGLTKKLKGRITLTKKGEQMMKKEKRLELFKLFLIAYTVDFSWAYNDGYPKGPIGQLGCAFSAFLLNKFGDEEQPANFYSLKYLKALPNLLPLFSDQYSTKEELFSNCYNLRVIKRFLFWFGLVKIKKNQNDIKYSDKGKVIKTNTLNEVFDFDD